MLTLSQFRIDYPEFRTIPDAQVQSALDKAALRTSADVLGTFEDEYHGNRTADILISKPSGASGRQVPEGEKKVNVYAQKCEELETLTCGFQGGAP
jgi:hypothetical protein